MSKASGNLIASIRPAQPERRGGIGDKQQNPLGVTVPEPYFPFGSIIEPRASRVAANHLLEGTPLHMAVYHPNISSLGNCRVRHVRADMWLVITAVNTAPIVLLIRR